MENLKNLTKGDSLTIIFPEGSAPEKCTFLKPNKANTKVQVQNRQGRLMWYSVDFIVDQEEQREVEQKEAEQHEKEGVEIIERDKEKIKSLDEESEEAQKQLDKIERLKNSDNRVDKKVTKKTQIIALIKAGKSNKDVCQAVVCDPGYVSDLRLALYKSGEINEELFRVRHGSSGFKAYEFEYKNGTKLNVMVDGESQVGYVTQPEKNSTKSQFFVKVVFQKELLCFSKSTGVVKGADKEAIYLITDKQ